MTRGDIYWTLLTVELFESTVDSMLRALAAGSLKELSREAGRRLDVVLGGRREDSRFSLVSACLVW